MKKIIFTFLMLVFFVSTANIVFGGGDDYTFSLDYEGGIVAGEQKNGSVTLEGVDSPVQSNVRIKVDITGPATPEILATDSLGNELDIAKLGYWGPDAGFTVGGTFTNVTPIKATFPTAGSYEVSLSLIDVNSPNTEYASNTFVITVSEQGIVDDTQNNNNNNSNNNQTGDTNEGLTDGDEELGEITELPQTGNYNFIYFIGVPLIALAGTLIYFAKIRTNN